jgi:hypothetical protein
VLLQNGKPIAYESRKLLPAERNYTTTEQELLAVVHALEALALLLGRCRQGLHRGHRPLSADIPVHAGEPVPPSSKVE